ncbi:MAG: C39 family peptidase [Pirellulales bacterium]
MRYSLALLFVFIGATPTIPLCFSADPPVTISKRSARHRSVLIRDVPHIRQKPDFCGEACAAMFLQRLGYRHDQDAVFDFAGLSSLEGRGCHTPELNRALLAIGFETGIVWNKVESRKANAQLKQLWNSVHADLAQDIPSIVCMRYDERPNTTEHFRLILGYDSDTDEVIYHEPAERDGAYRRMPHDTFLSLWPLKYKLDQWTVVRMKLKPDQIKRPLSTSTRTSADYAQHIRKLKDRIPNDDFHIVVEKPFVVIGDEPAEQVRRRASGTIRWAVTKLKKDYFTKDPDQIIDIWLFKDKTSYNRHVEALFGEAPGTPYGYYSPTHRALVMNISTGGGTLVHEIVHPFIAANFPDCPAWFNEGLASLYEQCSEVNDRIHGHTNWRLTGLQRAIRANHLSTFDTMCGTSTRDFYHDSRGTNYAQARYLCYYLQEEQKLREFYRSFRKNVADDPTGLATLRDVLGEPDLRAFQKRWSGYVMKLTYN